MVYLPVTSQQILQDLDGTLTGLPGGGWATPYYAHNLAPHCYAADYTMDSGIVCDSAVTIRRLQILGVSPSQLSFQVRCSHRRSLVVGFSFATSLRVCIALCCAPCQE